MGSLEQGPLAAYNGGTCDESKCVSKGVSYLYNDSFTCYGDTYGGNILPMMCADGYLPKTLNHEPLLNHTTYWGQFPVAYFTCCPPSNLSSIESDDQEITRQCSDPITTSNDFEVDEGICDSQDTRKYPRKMKTSRGGLLGGTTFDFIPSITDSVVCCDSVAPVTGDVEDGDTITNYLDDAECVPYRNEFYESKKAKNIIGVIRAISCDFPDGDFVYPRALDNHPYEHVVATGTYQCCKEGPSLPPFVHDSNFNFTIHPVVTLWSISAFFSAIVAAALLIPLLIQLKKGTFQKRSNRRSTSIRSVKDSCYSTFNLYVVYLSFADLLFCLLEIGLLGSYMNQKFNLRFHAIYASPTDMVVPSTVVRGEGAMVFSYVFINMWINAIISYELLVLLRKSKRGQRIQQPSLRTVNMQAGAIFFFGLIYCFILSALASASTKAGDNLNIEKVNTLTNTINALCLTMFFLPLVFIGIIAILIWHGGYIPKKGKNSQTAARDRAMRQLVFFFLRIVAVFFLVWFPAYLLQLVGILKYRPHYFVFAWCLTAMQPIISTCVILTKYDVRKYIYNFISMSYIFDSGETQSMFSSSRTGGSRFSSVRKQEIVFRPKRRRSQSLKKGSALSAISGLSYSGVGDPGGSNASVGGVESKSATDEADLNGDDLYFSVLGFVPDDVAVADVESNNNSVIKPDGDCGTGDAFVSDDGTDSHIDVTVNVDEVAADSDVDLNANDDYVETLKQDVVMDRAPEHEIIFVADSDSSDI